MHNPDNVGVVRQLLCRQYSNCLAFAVAMSWEGFSCGGCGAFEALGEDEIKADREAILHCLLAAKPQLAEPDGGGAVTSESRASRGRATLPL